LEYFPQQGRGQFPSGGNFSTPDDTRSRTDPSLPEDLALEILASYTPEDFASADFSSLGTAAVYLADHEGGPGPALQELIAKIQKAAGR
jgi:hypothetical protein